MKTGGGPCVVGQGELAILHWASQKRWLPELAKVLALMASVTPENGCRTQQEPERWLVFFQLVAAEGQAFLPSCSPRKSKMKTVERTRYILRKSG